MELTRRQTFTNWPIPSVVNPDQLAASGFFHLRLKDHVQCVFCQGIVGFWETGDIPDVEHRRHFPKCPFVTRAHATGNVPIPSPDATGVEGTGGQMAFPHLNTANTRLATFTHWPQEDVGVSGEELAWAGFFSTGLADWVQCFHCSGGLFAWRRGDDPLRDHARYYPFCPYRLLGMGLAQESVKEALKRRVEVKGVLCRSVTEALDYRAKKEG
ncbi:hypothetical protein Pmani_024586 [Petrolisthes manimaculis]|uniref:Inhibitor of apoptosis 2 n=1 Tax=Petrolisthes manimaculis TaxID=1843537 RepID=A0AAE1P763_9EUCA|nr:hypothetical protein Pmani_024586 [Petrolisthes manimaculis]